jgi:hypothetical protein
MAFSFQSIGDSCSRAKIPGGWLVLWFERGAQANAPFTGLMPVAVPQPGGGGQVASAQFSGQATAPIPDVAALTFVPDPTHSWDGNSLP